jgi:hypothetical protein
MTPYRRRLACAIVGALGLSVCTSLSSQTAPKPAAPPAPAPAAGVDMKRLASEVWIYAFPLVLTDVTREVQSGAAAPNTFRHRRTIPDATSTDANPNADFLYSYAWLDLSKGPLILSVPDTKGRYYLLALLDAYTNVAGSIGTRTTGTEKRQFAIVGPRWKGALPPDTSEVRSPTELAWIFGRTAVTDKADLGNANKIQDQYKLASPTPPAKGAKGAPTPSSAAVDTKTPPRDQVAAMDATKFFTRVAMLLPGNPPTKDDAAMLDKIKKLGIEPGKPFAVSDPATAKSIEEGVKTAIDAVATASKGLSGADIRNGWRIDRALGRWGTEYGRRAVAAWNGIGLNAPEDAIFMSTYLDGTGKKLDGTKRYVLHFDAPLVPPTDGFWSVSLYDDKQQFIANPQGRYHLGSYDKIKTNADGSIDIYISNADPGKDKEANWLPAPKGPFNLILRVYWPKQELIDGRWNPPGVRPAS